jgi:hypothetical protein
MVAMGFFTYCLFVVSCLSFMASDKGYITAKEWAVIILLWFLTFSSAAGTICCFVLAIRSVL